LVGARGSTPDELDLEAERLLDAYDRLQHPFIPNQRVILQRALDKDQGV
jgi:hypothetical protein